MTLSVSTLLVAGSGTALADVWGGVDCGQANYAGCRLGAGQGGQPDKPPSPPQQPGQSDGSESDGGSPPRQQGDQILGDPNLANCRYVPSDYQPPSQGTTTVAYHPPKSGGAITVTPAVYRPSTSPAQARFAQQQPPGQSGAWYVYQCSGQGFADALYRPPIWIPNGPQPTPSPEQLAQQAYNQLRLPSPQIHASPAETQLVNLPTWLWMDRSQWRPQTATASVPGVSVTATATPQSVTWSMGDGSTITCQGAGSPFPAGGDPKAASPDCGHTYRQTSQGQPNNTYPVAATVHWTVAWSGAGQDGTFPDLTTTSNATFAVAESQALNNAPR
ncbi:hypothetical protein GCM10023222_48460 [Saccharopolyspora cebuensis]